MSLIPNGLYKILNVQYSTLDADLLSGQPTSAIVGYTVNSNSLNFVWNLTNVGNQVNEFTLTNAAQSSNGAYVSVDQTAAGAALHGGTNAIIWTAMPAFNPGQYWIAAPASTSSFGIVPSQLVWSLDSGNLGTQIKLASIADLSQVWTFQAAQGTNSARELNALD